MNEENQKKIAIDVNVKPAEKMNVTFAGVELITLKGDKGEKGDMPSVEELTTIIKPLIPDPIPGTPGESITGPQGPEGKSIIGPQGPAGKDADEENIAEKVAEKIGKPKDGKDGKDGSADTGIQIIEKINKSEAQIDSSRIRGALPQGYRQASKTVSLKELDDVDLSSATKNDKGDYIIPAVSTASGSTNDALQLTYALMGA